MKEYFGKSSKIYHQTKGKRYLLLPAIDKQIEPIKKGKLLDVACGNGDFGQLCDKKGYDYYGLDISKDMIARAKQDYPNGKYLVSSSTSFAHRYKEKFDVIIISMLFPALQNLDDMEKTLNESRKVLKKNGNIIIGVTHPCFDHYMQKFLFDREDVETNFKGYYSSGEKFKIPQKFKNGILIFKDYHWTISDYFNVIKKMNLDIKSIDECAPCAEAKKEKLFYAKRKKFPIYLVFTCGKTGRAGN